MDIETYYSFPNITKTNNSFRYYSGAHSEYRIITLDTGAYEIDQLVEELNFGFRQNGETITGSTYPITFIGNGATLRCEMSIITGYTVDFAYETSFHKLLGFDAKEYTAGYYKSEHFVDIMHIDSIYVNCDLINNSYSNDEHSTAIYSLFPTVGPGSKIVEKANHLVFLPINRRVISSITFWLSDQDSNIINFRNLNVSIRFYLRKTPFK